MGHQILTGAYVDVKAGRVTVRDYAQTWLEGRTDLRPNSKTLYDQHLRRHIVPRLGGRRIGSLTRADMKAFVAQLDDQLAPATVHTVFKVTRAMLQDAVHDAKLPSNPCSRVPLPRVEKRLDKILTPDQIGDLAAAITPRYEVTVWLGALAGLRLGEALGLTKDHVDLEGRRILVVQQMQNGVLSPLKTKASRRSVPVDDLLTSKLRDHLKMCGVHTADLLVTNRCRRPVRRSSFGACFAEAVEGAGLPKGTRFHDLRHFYISSLVGAGVNLRVVQARAGHGSLTETADTYSHLMPTADTTGAGVLDSAFAGVPSLCPEGSPADSGPRSER